MSFQMTFHPFGGLSLFRILPVLTVCLIGFALVHFIKLMRLYLVVMEQHIPIKRFIPAYLRTTLVNILVPYKLGEIYRVAVFSRISGNFSTGLFSVLVDRFFDTLALLIILLPYQLLSGRGVTLPVIFLTVFLLVLIFAYAMYPSSYRYLNRYIITSRKSKSSLTALKWLETLQEWREYVRTLVSGRYGLLVLFSLAAWLAEMLVLMGIASLFRTQFSVSDFGDYISSILSSSTSKLSVAYSIFSVVVIGIACVIFTIIYCTDKKKEQK